MADREEITLVSHLMRRAGFGATRDELDELVGILLQIKSATSDYQRLRGTSWEGKSIILGALSLYLDFINMFLFLLRFMGAARD